MSNNGNLDNCEEALVLVNCPFCGEEIVRAYDHSMIPDDLSEEEREELTIETVDITDGICDHLAFRSDWAYSGSEYISRWQQQMGKLAASISGEMEEDGPDIIAEALHVDSKDLYPYAAKILPEYFFECTYNFVEKFDGPSSGGPTYMCIFLKTKG